MSRIGKLPIQVPAGVSCEITNSSITIKGPLGTDSCDLMNGIAIKQDGAELNVFIANEANAENLKAAHGLIRSLVSNIVTGVSKGFEKDLELQGVGYKVTQQGEDLKFDLGFSHPVIFKTKEFIKLKAIDPTHLKITGINKQVVGQTAAEIRELKRPEPYKGKGIRYNKENVRRKAGKTGKK